MIPVQLQGKQLFMSDGLIRLFVLGEKKWKFSSSLGPKSLGFGGGGGGGARQMLSLLFENLKNIGDLLS